MESSTARTLGRMGEEERRVIGKGREMKRDQPECNHPEARLENATAKELLQLAQRLSVNAEVIVKNCWLHCDAEVQAPGRNVGQLMDEFARW